MNSPELSYRPGMSRKVIGGLIVAAVIADGGVTYFENIHSPEVTYISNFTDGGKCLAGTLYDPARGAHLTVGNTNGTEVLADIPEDANFQSPAALFFNVINDGELNPPKLAFADPATAAYANLKECPGQPSGF